MVDVANNNGQTVNKNKSCEFVSIVNCQIWPSRTAADSPRRDEAVHEFQLQLLAGTRTLKCRNYKISCPAPLFHAPEIIILGLNKTDTPPASWLPQLRGEFEQFTQ